MVLIVLSIWRHRTCGGVRNQSQLLLNLIEPGALESSWLFVYAYRSSGDGWSNDTRLPVGLNGLGLVAYLVAAPLVGAD